MYPEYVERMLAGSAVLRQKFPDEAAQEVLGVLSLSEDLEILNFETSETACCGQDRMRLKDVEHVEISRDEISEFLKLSCVDGSVWRLEFPDPRIFADWSYGLQVLTVESEISSDEISDLLREATDLNAKLLEDNVRLQQAVEVRDDLIKQLVAKIEFSDQHKNLSTHEVSKPLFRDWHKVSKSEMADLCSARSHSSFRPSHRDA